MAHYAQIDANNQVVQVLCISYDTLQTGLFGDPSKWLKTSYNTTNGVHKLGGKPLRKNFAGIGYTYNEELDAFIPPRPPMMNSWVINENTGRWEPPIPRPTEEPTELPSIANKYNWDETTQSWVRNDIIRIL